MRHCSSLSPTAQPPKQKRYATASLLRIALSIERGKDASRVSVGRDAHDAHHHRARSRTLSRLFKWRNRALLTLSMCAAIFVLSRAHKSSSSSSSPVLNRLYILSFRPVSSYTVRKMFRNKLTKNSTVPRLFVWQVLHQWTHTLWCFRR